MVVSNKPNSVLLKFTIYVLYDLVHRFKFAVTRECVAVFRVINSFYTYLFANKYIIIARYSIPARYIFYTWLG